MPQQHPNLYVRRERDPRALRRQCWLLVCCLVLAAGFVLAARQQIAAVRYGYKTEGLRRERERLLEEQRRLQLVLGQSVSPAQLERSARALGMQPVCAAQIAVAPQGDVREQRPAARPALLGAATATAPVRR